MFGLLYCFLLLRSEGIHEYERGELHSVANSTKKRDSRKKKHHYVEEVRRRLFAEQHGPLGKALSHEVGRDGLACYTHYLRHVHSV